MSTSKTWSRWELQRSHLQLSLKWCLEMSASLWLTSSLPPSFLTWSLKGTAHTKKIIYIPSFRLKKLNAANLTVVIRSTFRSHLQKKSLVKWVTNIKIFKFSFLLYAVSLPLFGRIGHVLWPCLITFTLIKLVIFRSYEYANILNFALEIILNFIRAFSFLIRTIF